MNNAIKIGIVGLGRAGWSMHTNELAGKEDMFRITAACDIIPERTERMRERCGCRTYDSIDELLADSEVELVDIATRSCDHYAHACKALAAGKSVVLEKPACVTYEQFADLMTRANQPGLPRLFFRQNRRFETGFTELKRIMDSGILGHVFELQLTQYGFERRDDWQTLSKYGGGQLNNWGPHLIDHALRMLEAPVTEVTANRILGAAGGDCEDHFSLHMTAQNGRYATVSISGSTALHEGRRYTVYGSRGAADMMGQHIHVRYVKPELELPPVESNEGTPNNEWGPTGTFKAVVQPEWLELDMDAEGEDLSVFWIHLYESFRNGTVFPIKDEEVTALMQVLHMGQRARLVRAQDI